MNNPFIIVTSSTPKSKIIGVAYQNHIWELAPIIHSYYLLKTWNQHHLTNCTISMTAVTRLPTLMHFHPQVFGCMSAAIWSDLTRCCGIDLGEVRSKVPAHPSQNGKQLPKGCIHTVFTEHTSLDSFVLKRFSKNRFCLVAQLMCGLQIKIFSSISYMLLKFDNLLLYFLPQHLRKETGFL